MGPRSSLQRLDRYKASSLRAYNEKLPERYDTSLLARIFRPSRMDKFVLSELGSDVSSTSILDVGCATGRLLEHLAMAGARSLAGSELAPRILEVARRKMAGLAANLDLRCADAETSLPWPASAFDVVVLTGVLHHFLHPEAALAQIERVLRAAGRLILVDACFFWPMREVFNLCLRVYPHEGDCIFWTPTDASRLLSDRGWTVMRCERLNWWAFGVVARKAG